MGTTALQTSERAEMSNKGSYQPLETMKDIIRYEKKGCRNEEVLEQQ